MLPNDRHALVIGAGLAGAAVCVALARRGWRLSLLDEAPGPAGGASALPVGMLSPHMTRSPTPLSRLSELGVQDTRAQLERWVPVGAGWTPCEVDHRGHAPGRWPAALVRPAALVQAWLAEAAARVPLQTHWSAHVSRLRSDTATGHWQALSGMDQVVAEAPVVVIAAAVGSLALLQDSADQTIDSLPLRPVRGQMSLAALEGPPLAERPQRDNGVFVPLYEDRGLPPHWPSRLWAMGSTYERGSRSSQPNNAAHARNADSLQALCPPAADRLRQALSDGELLGWAQVRCASLDRLPLVGALPHLRELEAWVLAPGARRARVPLADVPRWPGLYTLSALGSRGLTLAHWCARQLARQMDGLPAEVADADQDLISAIDPARFAWKLARRQPQGRSLNT